MSTVSKCIFYVYNNSSNPISGTATHSYEGLQSSQIPFNNLPSGASTEPEDIESGTDNTDSWEYTLTSSPFHQGTVWCKVTVDASIVMMIFTDKGVNVLPSDNSPNFESYS